MTLVDSVLSRKFSISFTNNKTDNVVQHKTMDIQELVSFLTADPELDHGQGKDAGRMWSAAKYRPGATKGKEGVVSLSCIALDFDRGKNGEKGIPEHEVEELFSWLDSSQYYYVAHNSYTSGDYYPNQKLRAVLFFDRDVTPEEYEQLWPVVAAKLPLAPDGACKNIDRLWYAPRIPAEHAKYYDSTASGHKFLNVNKLLGKAFGLRLNAAHLPREKRTESEWLQKLEGAIEKEPALNTVAYALGANAGYEGLEFKNAEQAIWDKCRTALENNKVSDPVKDWRAAKRTCDEAVRDGYEAGSERKEKDTKDSNELNEAVQKFVPGEKVLTAALTALRKEIKLVREDYNQAGNAAYRLGRYTPHVLSVEYVRKEIFKAVTQDNKQTGSEGFLSVTEAEAKINTGIARGQKQPLFIYTGWRQDLVIDEEKRSILACDENAALFFQYHPDVEGLIKWNVRKNKPSFEFAPPWRTSRVEFPCAVEDHDAVDAGRWLAKQLGRPLASSERTLKAINTIAAKNKFDPFRDWLEGLRWDGTPRLDFWLHNVCGVEDNEYHRLVGSKFVISAVARTLQPGCDAQHVLVLVGPQGLYKSHAFRELCGAEYFCSNIGDIHKEEAIFNLEKYVIVELAELAAFKKAEMEVIKRFISDTNEDLRRKYAHNSETIVRRAVFGGTTNVKEFLADPTGNRRFWPVECTKRLNTGWLEDYREQVWAEALQRKLSGEHWWPTPEQENLFNEERKKYADQDDLMERLGFFESPFTAWPHTAAGQATIHSDQLDVRSNRFLWATIPQVHLVMGTNIENRGDQIRVKKMCLARGWVVDHKDVQNKRAKIWKIPAEITS